METGEGTPEAVAQLVPWTATQPLSPTLDHAGSVRLLPSDDTYVYYPRRSVTLGASG